MLFRFLIILALTYAVFFLLRWLISKRRAGKNHASYHGKKTKGTAKAKRGATLIRDPKTGEYRPQRDSDDE